MITNLIKAWSEQAFSSKIIAEFLSMLDSSEEMLSYVFDVLTGKIESEEFAEQVYIKDQSINLREQDIRRRILIHLSTSRECNFSACLALISVSKDAERLGDYVKNIFELKNLIGNSNCDRDLFVMLFEQIGRETLGLFRKTAQAFRKSDRGLAADITSKGREIAQKCEEIIEKVAESDYSARQAVIIALGARYIKRIALHLSNIASSVINPLPELDYFDSKGE